MNVGSIKFFFYDRCSGSRDSQIHYMYQDIHSILAKYFSGQATAEEAEMVKNWAVASDENAADFNLLEKLWQRSGEQEQQVFNTEIAWRTVHGKITAAQSPSKVLRLIVRRAMAAAAVIILAIGAWWIFFPHSAAQTILADTEVREVHMKDGSTIYLRKGASLEIAKGYGDNNRNLSLDGEAFFEVTPNKKVPFIINTSSTRIQVVGTSFLVNTNDDQVALKVRTGLVSFSSKRDENINLMVAAGEQALFQENELEKTGAAGRNFDSWRTQQLVFVNTPLQSVAADIREHFRINFSIAAADSARIANITLTAQFNNQPLDSVLHDLSVLSTYTIRKIDDVHYEIGIK